MHIRRILLDKIKYVAISLNTDTFKKVPCIHHGRLLCCQRECTGHSAYPQPTDRNIKHYYTFEIDSFKRNNNRGVSQ